MRRLLPIIILFGILMPARAQKTLSLSDCRKSAMDKTGLTELREINRETGEVDKKLIVRPFLPEVNAYAHGSYQSDAPNIQEMINFNLGIDPPSKWQYHAGIGVSQTLYKGGSLGLKKGLNEVEHALEANELDKEEIILESRVDEIYLSLLLAVKQEEILSSQAERLQHRLDDATKAYESGYLYRKDILPLETKMVELEGKTNAAKAQGQALRKALGALTGMEIGEKDILLPPDEELLSEPKDDPAFGRLELEEKKIELGKKMAVSAALPRLEAFGTLGYGQWPLNILRSEPDVYGIVGLSLVVPVSGWMDVGKRKRILEGKRQMIDIKRNNLLREQESALANLDGEIERYTSLADGSRSAVEKYESLADEMKSLSERGEVPVSDYTAALDQLSAAKLEAEAYEIMKMKLQLQRKHYLSTL